MSGSDPPRGKLDIIEGADAQLTGRPFLSLNFACCNVYQRIYRSADGTNYQGRCPRCGKPVRFEIGPGGTDARSFTVY